MSGQGEGGPVMPEVRQNVLSPAKPGVGRVVSTALCTAGGKKAAGFVRHVVIDVSGTGMEGTFRAGQSFGVLPPGVDEQGRAHKLRLYSIASPTAGEDGAGRMLATTVKRVVDEHWERPGLFVGVASNYLCDLRPGDEVSVTGPTGKRFVLPEDPGAHDYVFFATGTGIAPFRGMLGDLRASGGRSRAVLVMGSPYASDLLYHQELLELERKEPWFRYVTAISRERQADVDRPLYVQDRIAHDPVGGGEGSVESLLRSERTLVYVCGIAGMEIGIFRAMAGVLGPEALSGYLEVSGDAGDPSGWDRRMINRQLRVTRRLMLEVY